MEEILLERQENNVSDIRRVLDGYRSSVGSFPNTLAGLLETPGSNSDSANMVVIDDWSSNYYALKSIPTDVYTKQPYSYEVKGDDYVLKYQIKLPPFTPLVDANLYIDYGLRKAGLPYQQELGLKFVDGENIATKDFMSVVRADTIDTDKDNVADQLEKVIGTDVNKKDTDGDGFSDYEELTTGSNPVGPGRLGGEEKYPIF